MGGPEVNEQSDGDDSGSSASVSKVYDSSKECFF